MSARVADLAAIADCWQRALDADYRALNAVEGILPRTEISPRLYRLAQERRDAELLLSRLARTTGCCSTERACGISATTFRIPPDGAAAWAAQAGRNTWSSRLSTAMKGVEMRKLFEIGGVGATIVLIVFGIVSITMGVNGRNTVRDSIKQEQIVGTPDMNKAAIAAEAKKAGLPASIKLPTADIAGKPINSGARARDFATYMRIHALEATGGVPYSQLPRFATADGKGTNDATKALMGSSGQPVDNPIRNVWITETALSTALNASYLAENVALFGVVVGVALLLTGIGFGVLVVGGSLRGRENALQLFGQRTPETTGAKPVPVA